MRARLLALAVLVLAAPPGGALAFDHSTWDTLLQRYVDDAGRVAYRTWSERDAATLDTYLAALDDAEPDGWPREEQLAFWVNAYNALVVRAVLEGYTAENVLGRYSLLSTFKREIGDRARTPDDIEKHVLHTFHDPRVHFAIVCAALGCPRLRRRAFTAETADQDLDDAARRFLADPAHNDIKVGADTMRLSTIFSWSQADFGGTDDAIRAYVARYVEEPVQRYLKEKRPAVDYLRFDWTLNAQPGQRPR